MDKLVYSVPRVSDYKVWSLELVLQLFQYLVPDYQSFFLFCSPLIRVDGGRHRNGRIIYSGNLTWFVWVGASWPQSWMATTAGVALHLPFLWLPHQTFVVDHLRHCRWTLWEKRQHFLMTLPLYSILWDYKLYFWVFFPKKCCLDITPQESRYFV